MHSYPCCTYPVSTQSNENIIKNKQKKTYGKLQLTEPEIVTSLLLLCMGFIEALIFFFWLFLLFSFKLKDSYFLDGRRVAGLDYMKPVIFVYWSYSVCRFYVGISAVDSWPLNESPEARWKVFHTGMVSGCEGVLLYKYDCNLYFADMSFS